MNLDDYGIPEGISEVIITTKGERPNAAPIGIIRRDGRLFIRLFPDSHTYANVTSTGRLVANVSHDPVLFVESAFNDIPPESFEWWEDHPIISDAEAWILFEARRRGNDAKTTTFDLEVLAARLGRQRPRAVSRGLSAVLEATVHATRYEALRDPKYLERVRYYAGLVRRCGGPREQEAMKRLMEILEAIE